MKRVVACLCGVVLVASCGSSGAAKVGVNSTPPTASTAAAQSTTTVAPAPTAAPTVATTAAATTAATTAATVSPTTRVTVAPTTAAPTTTVAPTTIPATTTTTAGAQYKAATPPQVPSMTAAPQADNSHPDGVYYGTVTQGGDPGPAPGAVVFELVQLFVGSACTAHFGVDNPDSCLNDYGVDTNTTTAIEVPLDRQYITVADASTQKSYQITGPELYGLIHGDNPSAGAPSGYTYAGFGFFVTIAGGQVTRLEQWWTP